MPKSVPVGEVETLTQMFWLSAGWRTLQEHRRESQWSGMRELLSIDAQKLTGASFPF